MAKMFRTSGTGSQQQTLDTTDEKIKIYATDTALDTDLTNIPDGEIVATKESAGGGGSGYVGEIPLGTWASFENDTAPNSEWIQAGTTFDANVYPALAMMLGGNTIPERFDHNRLGDYEALSTSSFSPWTAPYDGVLIFCGDAVINVNGAIVCISTTGTNKANTLAVKKGDIITLSSITSQLQIKVAYYSHPMFIKATPTSNDSDYEGTLNSIREFYVRNNTYSTEERTTGGTWIDGKPIYRKVIETNARTIYDNWNTVALDASVHTDYVIKCDMVSISKNGTGGGVSANIKALVYADGTVHINNQYSNVNNTVYCILEYTKTTD